jgi:hypothetical protein
MSVIPTINTTVAGTTASSCQSGGIVTESGSTALISAMPPGMPSVAPASTGSTCAAESPTLARCGVAPSVRVRADECLASSAVAQETKIALTVARTTRVIAITTGTWFNWSGRMLLDEPSTARRERPARRRAR